MDHLHGFVLSFASVGEHAKPRLPAKQAQRAAHAPLASAERPEQKTDKDAAAFPEGRDRQGRLVPKGGAAKAEPRKRRQSRSDNTGASRTQ